MFIVYKDILINPVDVSWARIRGCPCDKDDCREPWAVIIHFRGVAEYLHFDFETREEAKNALEDFMTLTRLATNKDNK